MSHRTAEEDGRARLPVWSGEEAVGADGSKPHLGPSGVCQGTWRFGVHQFSEALDCRRALPSGTGSVSGRPWGGGCGWPLAERVVYFPRREDIRCISGLTRDTEGRSPEDKRVCSLEVDIRTRATAPRWKLEPAVFLRKKGKMLKHRGTKAKEQWEIGCGHFFFENPSPCFMELDFIPFHEVACVNNVEAFPQTEYLIFTFFFWL